MVTKFIKAGGNMSDAVNSIARKIIYSVLILLIVVSLIISSSVVYILATNHANLGQVIEVFTLIRTQSVEDISFKELVQGSAQGSIQGMIEILNDPYSSYLDSLTFSTMMERIGGTYGGVGLQIANDAEGRLVVVSPFRGTPAHRAGVAAGDFITQINGESTDDMELEIAARLMRGESGTEVTITIYREGRETWDIDIIREEIIIPTVDGQILSEEPDIAYIQLSTFNENTADQLISYLDELRAEGFRALILDLRNNPGGSLFASVEVARQFIPEGPVVYMVTRARTSTFDAHGPAIDVPLVVLVNSGSASASEIVAGAIQDTGVGILVGERTFGKGLVQSVFPIGDGSGLKLTTARYLTPGKRDINEEGIEPDVEIILTPEETLEALRDAPNPANDPQLQKAIEILQSQIN